MKDESNPAYEVMMAGITFLAQVKVKPAVFI
jgi:hypothetical protein